jgi:hypothetical protein
MSGNSLRAWWYQEDRKLYATRSSREERTKKLVEVENKYQSGFAEQLKAAMSGTEPMSESVRELQAALTKYETARNETIGHLYQLRKELVEGHSFVRDGDLAILDVPTVQAAVELRMTMASLIGELVGLLQSITVLEDEKLREALQKQAIRAALSGVRIAYQIKFLMARCDYYLKRARLDALKENALA